MTSYRERSIKWAQRALASSDAIILDTETTGLNEIDQVVQISIIDMQGNELFNSLIKPTVPVHPAAASVHGISDEQLATAPGLADVWEEFKKVVDGKQVVIYNSDFDFRLISQSLEAIVIDDNWEKIDWWNAQWFSCAMREYSAFIGEPSRRGGYRWQKLPGGDHSALGDCLATLAVIKKMAEAEA